MNGGSHMNKFELIEDIRRLNSTASVEFLSQFNIEELQEYVEHLMELDAADLSAAVPVRVPFN